MSSLTTIEKKRFEDLFGMGGGYVLDFTNTSFLEYFRDRVSVDIYSNKYASHGDSKAKRLRVFWNVEPDQIVGKVLLGLLELWDYLNTSEDNITARTNYEECRKIALRLIGRHEEQIEPVERFLRLKFRDITIDNTGIESTMVPVINARLSELAECSTKNAPFSVIVLCGSILEGLLLGVAVKNFEKFNKASSSPKDRNGKPKPIYEWNLSSLIDASYDAGYINLDVKKFSHALRDFRNFIHPYQQMACNFSPDEHTAKICLQVLKAAIASLTNHRKNTA